MGVEGGGEVQGGGGRVRAFAISSRFITDGFSDRWWLSTALRPQKQ